MIEWIESREPLTVWPAAWRRVLPSNGDLALEEHSWIATGDGRSMLVSGVTGGWVVADGRGRSSIEGLVTSPRHDDTDLVELLWHRGLVRVGGHSVFDGIDAAAAIEATRRHYTLVLLTSTGCNLTCSYCYLGHRLPSEDVRMPDATVRASIEAAVRQPWDEIMLDLGEIAVSGARFEEIARLAFDIASAHGKRLRLAVQTNGTMIDERVAATLAELDAVVGISLDGPAVLHDQARRSRSGAGSHERVLRALGLLRKEGVAAHLIATIARHNVGAPHAVVDEVVAQEPISFLLKPVLAEGEASTSWDQEGITTKEYARFVGTVLDRAIDTRDLRRLDQSATKFVSRFIGDRNGWRDSCTSRACGSGVSLHVVDPSGRTHACPRFVDGGTSSAVPVKFLDRIGRQPTAAIPEFGDLLPSSLRHAPHSCSGCPWLSSCGGGCTLAGRDVDQPLVPMPDPHCDAYDLTHQLIASRLIPAFLDGEFRTDFAFNGATVHRLAERIVT